MTPFNNFCLVLYVVTPSSLTNWAGAEHHSLTGVKSASGLRAVPSGTTHPALPLQTSCSQGLNVWLDCWCFFPSFPFCTGPCFSNFKVFPFSLADRLSFYSPVLVGNCTWTSSLPDAAAETNSHPTPSFAPPAPVGSLVSAFSALLNWCSHTGIPSCKVWLISLSGRFLGLHCFYSLLPFYYSFGRKQRYIYTCSVYYV